MQKSTITFTGAMLAGFMSVTQAEPKIEAIDVQLRYEESMSMEDLYRRIQTKAGNSCRNDLVLAPKSVRYRRECEKEFVSEAVDQFGLPELTSLHDSKSTGESARVAAKK